MKNFLDREKSPYLLQHKNNPVWWHPWGAQAFERARRENKPIFLSVGYSTCHWCHVMEKDSFEKQDIADVLNKNFVSIKVDREERPDVDSLYMTAVTAMTGSGGWPMSVMMGPDGKPFWGGTFLPHDNFQGLLTKVAELWLQNPEELRAGGERLAEFLQQSSRVPDSQSKSLTLESLHAFYESFSRSFDPVHGGNKGAPKFPPSLSLMALLRIHRRHPALTEAFSMAQKTLQEMRRGGVYDQLGGGFHRYSVDESWLIPHFEKMLYDNALLALVNLELYQVNQDWEFAQTAREILTYVSRDMSDPQGGFYSAEDADSENIEGKFYVWTLDDLKDSLGPTEFEEMRKTFNVIEPGNFQTHRTGEEFSHKSANEPPALSGNVLHLQSGSPLPSEKNKVIFLAMKKLFEKRGKRVRPHLDDKILSGWNGLMISAFAKGFQVLGDPGFLTSAQKAAGFVLSGLSNEKGELLRSYRDGEARHRGLCEDYAFFIQSCLDLYESDFDSSWLAHAQKLQGKQDSLFWDLNEKGYFESDGRDKDLLLRMKNFEDGVIPSSHSVSARNLLRLSALTGHFDYEERAKEILTASSVLIERYGRSVPGLLQSVDWILEGSKDVAIVSEPGDPTVEFFVKKLRSRFLPNMVLAWGTPGTETPVGLLKNRPMQKGRPTVYICRNRVCERPLTDLEQAFRDLTESAAVQS